MLYSDLEKDDNIMLSTVFHDHDVWCINKYKLVVQQVSGTLYNID